MINIANLNKAVVLAALFNASRQQGMGFLNMAGAKPMTEADAQHELNTNHPETITLADGSVHPNRYRMDFDYLNGRVLKVDISGDEFDARLFDRDNGPGAAAAAIDAIRPAAPAPADYDDEGNEPSDPFAGTAWSTGR